MARKETVYIVFFKKGITVVHKEIPGLWNSKIVKYACLIFQQEKSKNWGVRVEIRLKLHWLKKFYRIMKK